MRILIQLLIFNEKKNCFNFYLHFYSYHKISSNISLACDRLICFAGDNDVSILTALNAI